MHLPSSKVNRHSKKAYQGQIYHCLGKTLSKENGIASESIEFAYYPDGILLIGHDGKIEACGDRASLKQTVDLSVYQFERLLPDQLLLPGLIDLHVHLPQFYVTARQEDNLLQWLERHIFAEEMKFADATYAKQVSRAFFKALLKNGTTTACVFLTSHREASEIAFESARDIGNRVVMGLNLMDGQAPQALTPPTETLLKDTEELFQRWHGQNQGRILYAWMPRFALSCSESLMAGIGQLRKQYPDAYLHTHISEQPSEIEAVQRAFPWAKHYTDVYDHFGLLGPKTILAHGVHLLDDELSCIHHHQAGLAHCPSSNFFLKSGRFPWRRMLTYGIRFGMGSDVGAGPELSIFRTLRDAQFMQADELLSVHQLFYRATLGAAEVLHLEDSIGNFLPGKQADFIIADLSAKAEDGDAKTDAPVETMLAELVYRGDDRTVKRTFVAGQEIYRES